MLRTPAGRNGSAAKDTTRSTRPTRTADTLARDATEGPESPATEGPTPLVSLDSSRLPAGRDSRGGVTFLDASSSSSAPSALPSSSEAKKGRASLPATGGNASRSSSRRSNVMGARSIAADCARHPGASRGFTTMVLTASAGRPSPEAARPRGRDRRTSRGVPPARGKHGRAPRRGGGL